MKTEYIILAVVAVLIAFIIIGIISSKRARKNLYYRILSQYGQPDNKQYEYDEFNCISHFYKNTMKEDGDEFHIDDITWNDLDMDSIFLLINHTNSSVGREYLYKLLRTPVSDKAVLNERERLIQFFDKHKEERTNVCVKNYG